MDYSSSVSILDLLHQTKGSGKIIHENLNLLYKNDEVKDTFASRPMVSFRTSRKLSSYLVRAKLYPLKRTVGSRKCSKKRCDVCKNVQNSDTFWSSITYETFEINHQRTCDDKCLVYLLYIKHAQNSILEKPQISLSSSLREGNLLRIWIFVWAFL